jgi:CRP-like cAMP-binding protein
MKNQPAPGMTINLLNTIRAMAHLPAAEEAKLNAIASQQLIPKNERFLDAGVVPRKFAFVNRGLFRYFYVNPKGSEFTKGFFSENSFIISYTAMVRGYGSYYTIEALEDSEIVVIDYAGWKALYENHPCWSALLIAMLEKGFAKKETRERELLLHSAEERYRSFLLEYPQLEDRIKQHMVASYLGITPVALSRIRKSMNLTGKE